MAPPNAFNVRPKCFRYHPAAGTAILIPLTVVLEPTGAIIMLASIYYGAMYGGTITSVLLNVPGEAAGVVTCMDGYQMAKQGRAGPALAVAAIGSFVGGTVATMGLVLLALPLTRFALKFGPPEFFALMAVGLSLVTGLAGRSLTRALLSAILGLLVAQIGIDPVMGAPRFTFGRTELLDGFGIVPVVAIVDDALLQQPDVYFEAGDHKALVHVSGTAFSAMMAGVTHGRFTHHI